LAFKVEVLLPSRVPVLLDPLVVLEPGVLHLDLGLEHLQPALQSFGVGLRHVVGVGLERALLHLECATTELFQLVLQILVEVVELDPFLAELVGQRPLELLEPVVGHLDFGCHLVRHGLQLLDLVGVQGAQLVGEE
jgi:hypothetical protein